MVGLGIDPQHTALTSHLANLVQLRRSRVAAIGEKLRRNSRFADIDPVAAVLGSAAVPTRTHVCQGDHGPGAGEKHPGCLRSLAGARLQGYVPQEWPALTAAVAAIRSAGGEAVLAHPHRYKLSSGALGNLAASSRNAAAARWRSASPACPRRTPRGWPGWRASMRWQVCRVGFP